MDKKEILKDTRKRLDDALQYWHQCKSNYVDLDKFILNLNPCIQSLRSVTWLLQNQKDNIPFFNEWYEGDLGWQNAMKSDKIMKWLVDARNQIEKRGDLEVNSKFVVSVITGYNELPLKTFSMPPTSEYEDILKRADTINLPENVKKSGFFRIERQWISSTLPEYELLNSLAYVYGVLKNILYDADMLILKGLKNCSVVKKCKDDRPVYMQDLDFDRIEYFKIATGEKTNFFQSKTEYIPKDKIKKHYNIKEKNELKISGNFYEICEKSFELAKKVLVRDGEHCSIVILMSHNGQRKILNIQPENRSEKWLLWNYIANETKKTKADFVIFISEAWGADLSPDDNLVYAVDAPNKYEVLSLSAISFSEDQYTISCKFQRDSGEILLGKSEYSQNDKLNFFEPVKKVWRERRLGNMYTPFAINSGDLCPCLSGLKYKQCCKDQVQNKKYECALNLKSLNNFKKAEKAYRAWLTQYIIWYNEHTIPFVTSAPKAAAEFLEMDRAALFSICIDLIDCIIQQDRFDDAISLLKKYSTIIDDEIFRYNILDAVKKIEENFKKDEKSILHGKN